MIDFEQLTEENCYSVSVDQKEMEGEPFIFEHKNYHFVQDLKNAGKINNKFKIIDPSFLKMKNSNGTPKFSVFTFNHPDCFFKLTIKPKQTTGAYSLSFESNITSKVINFQYKEFCRDLLNKLFQKYKPTPKKIFPTFQENASSSMRSMTMQSKFEGLIPEAVRQNIKGINASWEFDEVILVCEAANWTIEEEVIELPKNRDPLVIGVKNNICYLLDKFDVTSLENYVSKEFV